MRRRKQRIFYFAVLLLLMAVMLVDSVILQYEREKIRMNEIIFTESARELRNPERGFYNLYAFLITDEKADYMRFVEHYYKKDIDTDLTLIEINLQKYRDGKISEAGLQNIEVLFQVLGDFEKQMIVRFVYDLEGENEKYEPDTVDVILGHMEQLEDILRKHSGKIYVLQGLFIGNWGEMNGTKYENDEDLVRLTKQLYSVTDSSTYLAVRTPDQWRRIMGIRDFSEIEFTDDSPAVRMSLFNDGMMGNESDLGTYKTKDVDGDKKTRRMEELSFQEQLCSFVPNGGEVVVNNPYNDFDNAVRDFATMHVTYLNNGYDQEVLDKWKKTKVAEQGCFNGVDGYTYMSRHLGYRLLIDSVGLQHDYQSDQLEVSVVMKNVGFAPLYTRTETALVFYDKKSGESVSFQMNGDLRQLTGGNESEKRLTLKAKIDVKDLAYTEYDIYFEVLYPKVGQRIALANEQEMNERGYHIGNVELYDLRQYLSNEL